MIGFEGKTFRSERLEYRLIDECDRASLRELVSDGSVTEPAGFAPLTDDAGFEDFFEGLKRNGCGVAVILDGRTIGYVRVFRENMDGYLEYDGRSCVGVGFVIAGSLHGQGLGTETLAFITAHLKERFDFVFADAFNDNPASNRVIVKCGYRYLENYTMFFEGLCCEKTCHSYVF